MATRNSASITRREKSPFLSIVKTRLRVTSSTFIKLCVNWSTSVTADRGGGIRAFNSSVTCEGICSFVNNSAEYGGGGVS